MNLVFEIHQKDYHSLSYEKDMDVYECFAVNDAAEKPKPLCVCKISASNEKWTISAWYTKNEYKNQGIGKQTLGHLLEFLHETYGTPDCIEYIWNGTNEYVGDWIKRHFDAECTCPIAVQKMLEAEDDWSSHVYRLNVAKVFDYFEIETSDFEQEYTEER